MVWTDSKRVFKLLCETEGRKMAAEFDVMLRAYLVQLDLQYPEEAGKKKAGRPPFNGAPNPEGKEA
jgi:hypothetical protein